MSQNVKVYRTLEFFAQGGATRMSTIDTDDSATILYWRPETDDIGVLYFGDGTKDFDVRFTLGASGVYAEFDVGNARFSLVGVDMATDAPVVITDATESTSTTTGALIVSGGISNAKDTYLGDDLFLTSGAVINWNAGDVTITHSANSLAIAGGTSYTFDAAILPSASNGAAIGSATVMWSDLFLASGAVVNFDNGDVTLTHAANLLTIAGGDVVVAGLTSSSATAGIGYSTGAGGTVTQLTSKSTGVTLNTVTGIVTMNNAALAGDTTVAFTLTDSAIAATDAVVVIHESGGTIGAYSFGSTAASGSVVISVHNNTAGSLSEAVVLRFVVVKSVNA